MSAIDCDNLLERERRELSRLEASNAAPEVMADAALVLLETAAMSGLEAWRQLLFDAGLAEIERRLIAPESLLAGLEQELLAPIETGLPSRAVAMIEALGYREASVAREAERLLHAAGEPEAAYRIEHVREPSRQVERRLKVVSSTPPLAVAVAGGHPRLRAMIRRDLRQHRVREIPSRQEASLVGRDVAAKLAGADLAVVIARQIAHSTSDQVIAAAEKQGVPVAFARSASLAAVRDEVDRFARERTGVE
jgi:hypothetical protein